MGRVTIRFIGLCIHLNEPDESRMLKHRVVLLAYPCMEQWFGHDIQPHLPELVVPDGTQITAGLSALDRTRFRLERVSMRVLNEIGDDVRLDGWDDVPKLTPTSERIGLRTDVAYEGAAPASVYFDIGHGRGIPCRSSHHAISTRFEIYTEGHPRLELRPFDGGEPSYLTVADGATILITNMSTELEGDHEFDYLLNYGIMYDTLIEPAKPRMPSPLILQCHTLDPGDDLGPSCSNSNFP